MLKALNVDGPVAVCLLTAIVYGRFDAQHGADREVQRILLELLNQMDGFDQSVNVKVIMATNRQDTLDPALLRPGRLDRKVEFPVPDRRQKRLVFQAATAKMNLSDEVDLEQFVSRFCLPCPLCCCVCCVCGATHSEWLFRPVGARNNQPGWWEKEVGAISDRNGCFF